MVENIFFVLGRDSDSEISSKVGDCDRKMFFQKSGSIMEGGGQDSLRCITADNQFLKSMSGIVRSRLERATSLVATM